MAKPGPEGPDQDATGDRAEPSNSGGSTDAARGQDTQIRRTSVRERLAGPGAEESGSGTDRPRSEGDDATEELQPEDSEADAPQADERGAAAKPGGQGSDERSAAEGPRGGMRTRPSRKQLWATRLSRMQPRPRVIRREPMSVKVATAQR